MRLLFRNPIFRYLTFSRLFNTIGASIYNLVFVVFASTMPLPKLAIGIANFIVLVPTFVTIFVGIKADRTDNKARWIIHIGYTQAILFVIIAFLTKSSSYLAFGTVCLINILSDVLSDYRSGLQMPIMQHNVAEEDLMEAYSFNQALAYLANLGGQALGVWLLTISQNNFFLVALINAITFLLSSTILFLVRKQLIHAPINPQYISTALKEQVKEMYKNAKLIFEQDTSTHFLNLLGQILILNALFGSLSGLYNLHLLEHPFGSLSFSQSILVIDVLMVGGVITSSLFPHDFFAKQSLPRLGVMISLACMVLGVSNALSLSPVLSLLAIAFSGYVIGKVNPMVQSMLMSKLKPEVLAQTSSFLSLIFTLSMPLGSILFTTLAIWHMPLAWLTFTFLAICSLALGFYSKKKVQ